jgi:hypothetical protein
MTATTCNKCGHQFDHAGPRPWYAALVSQRDFLDNAPELRDAEVARCPHCGEAVYNQTYKFFGVLSARGMRVLIGALIAVMLLFAVCMSLRDAI